MSTPPETPAAVAGGLLSYCRGRLGGRGLHYRRPPAAVPNGWETYTYRLQFAGRGRLPDAFRRPLALRLYAGAPALPRARREFRLRRRLAELGYPVARPALLEEDAGFLGGPFLLSEWAAGRTLLGLLHPHPWSMGWAPLRMAEAHARLHRLPAGLLPHPSRPFLDRTLDELGSVVARCGLRGLAPGLRWLRGRRPPPADEPPCLLHLDFHPDNILMHGGRCAAVLDWGDADVGDRHADAATTLFIVATAPVDAATAWDRLLLPLGRLLLRCRYLRGYRRRLPLDRGRLRYFGAWAALRRLATLGRWLHDGPAATGCKPAVLDYLRPDYVAAVERYFRRCSGVAVRLDPASGSPRGAAGPRPAAG
jgi:aminoglycoside phosphotransferase (APT) family kinase protein